MRSDLVFDAMAYVSNRYLLSKIVAKATRKFHKPGSRIQDTTNEVLTRFGYANPIAEGNSARVSAGASLRQSRSQPAIRRKPPRPTVPAGHETPHALSQALRILGA